MINALIEFFSGFPPELATVALATLPFTELRAALPIAITVLELSPASAYFFSILGNLIPLFLFFWLFPPILRFASAHWPWLERLLEQKLRKLEQKHKDRYDRYGLIFLVILVAIPLPESGVWTGSMLAILFDIDWRYSIPAIVVGLLMSGLIVLLTTQGVVNGLN